MSHANCHGRFRYGPHKMRTARAASPGRCTKCGQARSAAVLLAGLCRWSVVLERTARELAGTPPCMPVGFTPKDRQQLICSHMLGATVSTSAEMGSVLAHYASAAAPAPPRPGDRTHAGVAQQQPVPRRRHSLLRLRGLRPTHKRSTPAHRRLPIGAGEDARGLALQPGRNPAHRPLAGRGVSPTMARGDGQRTAPGGRCRPGGHSLRSGIDRLGSPPGCAVVDAGTCGESVSPPAGTTSWDDLLTVR